MATHSSIVAWRIPWMEELVLGVAKSRTRLSELHLQVFFSLMWDTEASVGLNQSQLILEKWEAFSEGHST